jgi:hypothetical protein
MTRITNVLGKSLVDGDILSIMDVGEGQIRQNMLNGIIDLRNGPQPNRLPDNVTLEQLEVRPFIGRGSRILETIKEDKPDGSVTLKDSGNKLLIAVRDLGEVMSVSQFATGLVGVVVLEAGRFLANLGCRTCTVIS